MHEKEIDENPDTAALDYIDDELVCDMIEYGGSAL
jgi:hypothetical protein